MCLQIVKVFILILAEKTNIFNCDKPVIHIKNMSNLKLSMNCFMSKKKNYANVKDL